MDFTGKRLLIMSGAYLHKKVVEAAREMDIYTIVIDNIENSPAKQIADKSYCIDLADVDGIVSICKKEKVDAVISVCIDFAQAYYQQVCERLSLPCFGTSEQFQTLTRKESFKRACVACGVDVIPSYELKDFLLSDACVEYPVLVKPSQNRGSRGIFVCRNRQEVLHAAESAKALSQDGKIIIEKHMCGKPDFQVTYLVVDGVSHVVRTADRFLGSSSDGMDRVAIALSSPSDYTDLYFERVHQSVKKLIKYLKIQNAPVFFQGFVDKDTIRFYDPGLRFPGGDYDRVFSKVMDINLMKSLIELAFTGKMTFAEGALGKDTARLRGNTIFTLHSTVKKGTVRYLTSIEELCAIDGVMHASYRHGVGDSIEMTYNVNQRILETNILGADKKSVAKTVLEVQNKLKVLDSQGENMIFCEFDAEGWASKENGAD